jgi:hypothetical protein
LIVLPALVAGIQVLSSAEQSRRWPERVRHDEGVQLVHTAAVMRRRDPRIHADSNKDITAGSAHVTAAWIAGSSQAMTQRGVALQLGSNFL